MLNWIQPNDIITEEQTSKKLKRKYRGCNKLEENSLAIPFDINEVTESVLKRIWRKVKPIFKNVFVRTLDIIGAIVGILFILPIGIVTYIENIKNNDHGPLFYTQERIGKDGKIFKMYKFRSMCMNAEEKLKQLLEENEDLREEYSKYKKLHNDPRVTTWGKFLRKTSLDEFPQFINVLKGEMTLVGPRPYLPREKEDMGSYYKYIVQHKPGVTGLWQISGRSDVEFQDRLDMDMEYHYRDGVKTKIKILLITVLVTLRRGEDRGAV